MKIKEVIDYLEKKFPLYWQEDYDNCGVQCGDINKEITGVLVCFNFSEKALEEAINKKANLVISHHPLIFKPLRKIEPVNVVGRLIFKAIEKGIVLYSMHTNIDSGIGGGNSLFAEKLELQDVKVLAPKAPFMRKLIFFAPKEQEISIMDALFAVGCGTIGNYKNCSFKSTGEGTFLPTDSAKPYIGELDITEVVDEVKVEMIFPTAIQSKVIQTLYRYHPYEEPAFDIFSLENQMQNIGLGKVGKLKQPMSAEDFFQYIKQKLQIDHFRVAGDMNRTIEKVAVCGGGGSGLIPQALAYGADIFITGDIKYHDFLSVDNQMIIADIGHYEGECFIKEIIYNKVKEKFSNFATTIFEGEKSGINLV